MTKKETLDEMSNLLLILQEALNSGAYQNIQLRLLILKIKEDIDFISRFKLSEKICLLILVEVKQKVEDLTKVDDDKKNIPFHRAPLS